MISVAGMNGTAARGPVTIADDIWGVPHIRAGSIPDAYFGQGYVVARDRLFQIDLQLRRERVASAADGPRAAREGGGKRRQVVRD